MFSSDNASGDGRGQLVLIGYKDDQGQIRLSLADPEAHPIERLCIAMNLKVAAQQMFLAERAVFAAAFGKAKRRARAAAKSCRLGV